MTSKERSRFSLEAIRERRCMGWAKRIMRELPTPIDDIHHLLGVVDGLMKALNDTVQLGEEQQQLAGRCAFCGGSATHGAATPVHRPPCRFVDGIRAAIAAAKGGS